MKYHHVYTLSARGCFFTAVYRVALGVRNRGRSTELGRCRRAIHGSRQVRADPGSMLTSIPGARTGQVLAAGMDESVPSPASAIASAAAASIASAAPSTTTSILARFRLVDRQAASAMVLIVQGVDGRKGISVRRHLDEAEATTPTSLSVHNHLRASHFAEWGEQVFQIGISHRKCEIADIQLLAHLQPPLGSGRAMLTRVRLSGSKESGRTGRPNGWARQSSSMIRDLNRSGPRTPP